MTSPDFQFASFGPFRLSASTRQLLRDGAPLILGDRAFDILAVLVENAGQIVSQKELMARVWRDLIVTPGNLRVHMTALRKALDDGQARYIRNVTGQGYCFVAPVTYTRPQDSVPCGTKPAYAHALPLALRRMIGRDETVRAIAADLRTDRFVTIVGPGGMGKTTVAVSVAHAMLDEFDDAAFFVDLGALTDPALITATVASTLGVSVQSADPLPALMSFLQTKRVLIVLDNCEHVIDAAASLAEAMFNGATDAHILATSREALRVEGEHAHWLHPLAFPAPNDRLSATEALSFPAVKLFVDRALASDSHFELTDENVSVVSEICGHVDGIALAIEIVAGRVGTYGLTGTADLLKKQLGLQWQGRRTSLPRHQTLQSLIDWSFGLLSSPEQQALRRLSMFVGRFDVDAAQAVASDTGMHPGEVAHVIDQLIAKSLVSSVTTPEGSTCYRLLETTRLYAAEKLARSGDADAAAERHARYFLNVLLAESDSPTQPPLRHDHLGNLRAALEWCFSAQRHPDLGIALAAAIAPLLLNLSLWSECRRWSESALSLLPDAMKGGTFELVLQEARSMSLLMTAAADARTAIDRGLQIARDLGEAQIRFRLLAALHVYLLRMTDFKAGLIVAEEMDAVAKESNDISLRAIADWMLGSSHFVLGNPVEAKQHFEEGFALPLEAGNRQQLAGMYFRTRALYGLARVLWLCGYPDRALRPARQAIDEAAATDSPVNVSYSLIYNCYVFLWCGELDAAQEMIEKVMMQPHWDGRLIWFHVEALALKGELLVRRGHLDEGITLLRRALADMHAASQKHLMLTVTACWLAEALAGIGQLGESLEIIDDAVAHSPSGEASWMAPELLRVRGRVLLSMEKLQEAEQSLLHSLALARRQGARGWELRTATTLSQLYSAQQRDTEARDLLSTIYGQFTEGFDTPDLVNTRRLLQELESTGKSPVTQMDRKLADRSASSSSACARAETAWRSA
ncbi:ATP-binding protein [Povalibacter sp.]|uniref:ATP-binding protein n=1 Tax=Povalibacter sp. TaxID=1962978 RepID=UPI002F405E0B